MIEPYQVVGLMPTIRGIRQRDKIGCNLDHLAHLIKAASSSSTPRSPAPVPNNRLATRGMGGGGQRHGGRHRAIPDRNRFAAIVFMARTSTPWRLLPAQELGCGSPATRRRRLAELANAGVFDQLHLEVLDRLGEQGWLDWSRASVDTMSVRSTRGGPRGRKSGRSWQAQVQAPPGL